MEHTFMRTSYDKTYGKLLQGERPTRQYISLKTVDVEEGEAKAEKLNEVGGVFDQQEELLDTTLDPNVAVKGKRGFDVSTLPKFPGQLQSQPKLMGDM
eukprot:2406162-Karenia_brevis.AAC.1